jgi:hypothetical protein
LTTTTTTTTTTTLVYFGCNHNIAILIDNFTQRSDNLLSKQLKTTTTTTHNKSKVYSIISIGVARSRLFQQRNKLLNLKLSLLNNKTITNQSRVTSNKCQTFHLLDAMFLKNVFETDRSTSTSSANENASSSGAAATTALVAVVACACDDVEAPPLVYKSYMRERERERERERARCVASVPSSPRQPPAQPSA